MPSEEATSTVAIVRTRCKMEAALFGQYVGCDTVISRRHNTAGSWIHVLNHNETPKTFDEFHTAIMRLDDFLMARGHGEPSFFLSVSETTGDKVLIGISGTPLFHQLFDERTGQFRKSVEVWRMESTMPPRKRPTPSASTLLIPGLTRLSKQLHVDFAINVHGGEGKRERKRPLTIYMDKRFQQQPTKKRTLSTTKKQKLPITSSDEASDTVLLLSNNKEELIRSMQATIEMKEKLINTQTALIATLLTKD
jgi:hypothetical protein